MNQPKRPINSGEACRMDGLPGNGRGVCDTAPKQGYVRSKLRSHPTTPAPERTTCGSLSDQKRICWVGIDPLDVPILFGLPTTNIAV